MHVACILNPSDQYVIGGTESMDNLEWQSEGNAAAKGK